jgi:hypothetical protein
MRLTLGASCLLGMIACAVGAADGPTELVYDGQDPPDAGTRRDAGAMPKPSMDAGAPVVTDAGTMDGGMTATADCKGTLTCATATASGSVSGDTGTDTVMVTGATSGWYTIRVTENNNGAIGRKLKLKATLTPASGSNYDVFLYENAPADCSTVWQSSTQPSGADTASVAWGEGTIANGKADDKDVTLEVRFVGGTCAATAGWTLQLEGNTN